MKPISNEQVEHFQFFFDIHRDRERLISIAKVDAAPNGSGRDRFVRPLSIRYIDRRKRTVFVQGLGFHIGKVRIEDKKMGTMIPENSGFPVGRKDESKGGSAQEEEEKKERQLTTARKW